MASLPPAVANIHTSSSPINLTSLPTELVQEIARYAGSDDIFSIRAVCRDVHDKVDDLFLKPYFSTRAHLTTHQSLEALAEIVKVPRLAKSLKELELEVVLLFAVLQERPESVAYEDAALARLRQYVNARWPSQGLDIANVKAKMANIFRTLAQHGNVPNITITLPSDGRRFKGSGNAWLIHNLFPASCVGGAKATYLFTHRTVARSLKEDRELIPMQLDATAAILDAIAESKRSTDSLTVKGSLRYVTLHRSPEEALCTRAGAKHVFANLKTISLGLAMPMAMHFIALLSTSQQLEHIALGFANSSNVDAKLLRQVCHALSRSVRLKTIGISKASLNYVDELIDLLSLHEQTLERFTLSSVTLDIEHEWRKLLTYLSTFPQLKEIGIHKMYGDRSHWTLDEIKTHEKLGQRIGRKDVMCDKEKKLTVADYRVCGKGAVKEVLEELASTARLFERFYWKRGANEETEIVVAPE